MTARLNEYANLALAHSRPLLSLGLVGTLLLSVGLTGMLTARRPGDREDPQP